MAERVLAGQGKGAWPVCGTGLGAANPTPVQAQTRSAPAATPSRTVPSAPPSARSAPPVVAPSVVGQSTRATDRAGDADADDSTAAAPRATTPSRRSAAARSYVVRSGDTLAKIAAAHQVRGGYQAIFALNRGTIKNVNLIYPGETLTLG